MTRCLIAGAGAFIGSHLAELLLEKGLAIFGTAHRDTRNVDHIREEITLLPCDIRDQEQVEAVVREAQPELVYHLAAQSLPVLSWQEPARTFQVNVLGTLHLLEAVRRASPEATVVVAGSSAEYGFVTEEELPIREDRPLLPLSPYGVSKVAADLLARLYGQTYGMRVIRVRPFFVTGPRKRGDVCSDFACGIVAVERGEWSSLRVGNLEPVRDFLDVRDAVRAMWIIVEKGEPGEVYNICSSTGHKVQEVLDILISMARVPVPVEQDPSRVRPSDEPVTVGDSSRLRALGWEPQVPLEKTLRDLLDYWRGLADGRMDHPAGAPTSAAA